MSETPPGGARATAVSVPSTSEIVVLFIPGAGSSIGPVNISQPNLPNPTPAQLIRGALNITTGGAGTNPTIKCRRGNGTTGTQVGTSQLQTQAVATSNQAGFCFQDNANQNPQQGYSITVTLAAGTATVNEIVGSIDDGT